MLLNSNEYWGRKGGTDHPVHGRIIKQKRWSIKTGGNSEPVGARRRRFYDGRCADPLFHKAVGAKKFLPQLKVRKSHLNVGH